MTTIASVKTLGNEHRVRGAHSRLWANNRISMMLANSGSCIGDKELTHSEEEMEQPPQIFWIFKNLYFILK